MYLSRLILNPLSRQVQQEIANPYQMHRTILHAFPQDLRANGERVLFRVDALPRTGQLHLLVQSQGKPDWTWLASRDGRRPYLAASDRPNPAVKQTDLQLAAGQVLAFRLLANPTKRPGKSFGPDKGKRVGLYTAEEQMAWLQRKADQSGFTVLTAVPAAAAKIADRTKGVELLSVRFDGLLQVQQPDTVLEAVRNGIGSGKAFGFGMLSVARPLQ